jgi:hypothetical protein
MDVDPETAAEAAELYCNDALRPLGFGDGSLSF